MKKSTTYLILAVIWALGSWAWIANVMRYAKAGAPNSFHAAAAACSGVCAVLNLFIYFQVHKKEK